MIKKILERFLVTRKILIKDKQLKMMLKISMMTTFLKEMWRLKKRPIHKRKSKVQRCPYPKRRRKRSA